MKLTVTIDCTTTAFANGRFDSELGRILRQLAERLQDDLDGRDPTPGSNYTIHDRNGEAVCKAEFGS